MFKTSLNAPLFYKLRAVNSKQEVGCLSTIIRAAKNDYSALVDSIASEILSGEIHQKKTPTLEPADEQAACANQPGYFHYLSASSYSALSRVALTARSRYEDALAGNVLKLSKSKQDLSLTFLASGHLYNELCCFFKTINFLKKEKWSGKIRLNFIDTTYQIISKLQDNSIQATCWQRKKINFLNTKLPILAAIVGALPGMLAPNRTIGLIVAAAVAVVAYIFFHVWHKVALQGIKSQTLLSKSDEIFVERHEPTNVSKAVLEFLELIEAYIPANICVHAKFFSKPEDYEALSTAKKNRKYHLCFSLEVGKPAEPALESLSCKSAHNHGEAFFLTDISSL